MEAFQNNPVGAPYNIKFEKIYEKMADVNTEEPEAVATESAPIEPVAVATVVAESTPVVAESTESTPVVAVATEPTSIVVTEENYLSNNVLMYIGLGILVGVILIFLFRFYGNQSKSLPQSTNITEPTYDFSLESPSTEPLFDTSDYGSGLANLKYLKF